MIGVNVWWVYLAPQDIPRAISILTLDLAIKLYCITFLRLWLNVLIKEIHLKNTTNKERNKFKKTKTNMHSPFRNNNKQHTQKSWQWQWLGFDFEPLNNILIQIMTKSDPDLIGIEKQFIADKIHDSRFSCTYVSTGNNIYLPAWPSWRSPWYGNTVLQTPGCPSWEESPQDTWLSWLAASPPAPASLALSRPAWTPSPSA